MDGRGSAPAREDHGSSGAAVSHQPEPAGTLKKSSPDLSASDTPARIRRRGGEAKRAWETKGRRAGGKRTESQRVLVKKQFRHESAPASRHISSALEDALHKTLRPRNVERTPLAISGSCCLRRHADIKARFRLGQTGTLSVAGRRPSSTGVHAAPERDKLGYPL